MAEPSTTTILAITGFTGITLSTFLLGLDGNAVVGAFAGAVLMVMSAKDIGWTSRVAYLVISWIMGYMAAPEIAEHTPIEHAGVAAFLAAALIVTVTLQLIEKVKTTNWLAWLTHRGGSEKP